jgi:hypothetical protein
MVYYDVDKMAEIIVCLIEKFGEDRLIKFMIDRLIRLESDYIIPTRKSKDVVNIEQKYGISLLGLTRKQIHKNKEASKEIIIEHGFPEGLAIDMCFKSPNKDNVKIILEDIKNNLNYITKEENEKLNGNGFSKQREKGATGFYWENAYKQCGIELVDN